MNNRWHDSIVRDIAIIFFSVLIALMLVQSDALTALTASAQGWGVIGVFVTGMFFTSVFTTAPAIVALAELSKSVGIVPTAIIGAFGAVAGDALIFRFVKDRLSVHVTEMLRHQTGGKRLKALLRGRYFRWLTFLVGGMIIASPLPDELGITLLGFSKMRTSGFAVLSFAFNFLGIVLIGLVAAH